MSEPSADHRDARAAVVTAAGELVGNGVLSRSGHANLSARVSDEAMVLTTSGRIRDLEPEALAVVGFDGTVLEGRLDPTNAEIVAMHAAVYRARPAVGGVVHTHSPNLLAFAMSGRPLPCRYEALLRFGQGEAVPVVPWAPRGSERSVTGIVSALRERPGTSAVLLGNHGVLVLSAGPVEAAALLTALEEAAQAELAAWPLGGTVPLTAGALEAVRASMARVR